ncbi:RNA-directed DNA polymerase, eukaryota [Tanacetum coccineum]
MPSLKRRSCLHHIYGNLTSFGDMYDSCLVSNDLDNCVEWAMFSQVDIPSLLLQYALLNVFIVLVVVELPLLYLSEESRVLFDIQMEGYSFTWAHPSASKMSKLDRFLLSNGLLSFFPHLSAVCLDRHLSDHRPILLKEIQKKVKVVKVEIRKWTKDFKEKQEGQSRDLNLKLRDIDKTLDQGGLR